MTQLRTARVSVAALWTVPTLMLAASQVVVAQSSAVDQFRQVHKQEHHLRSALPDADAYEFVDAELPYFRGFKNGDLVGLAFFTNELDPKVQGYKASFWMLVGMTPSGRLTGVAIDYHAEPFGYFSIDPPAFGTQFEGKSVMDPLQVGDDIDAVSRATITVESATRAIRQGSRQLMRQFLSEDRE